jgi:hypothetical protein
MTTNHHTPIAIGAPANANTFNTPLGQLDSAITDLTTDVSDAVSDVANLNTTVTNLLAGASGFTQLNLSTTTTLTVSSGAITVTRTRHLVDTEGSASYDDLDTINGGVAGDVLVLQSVTSARVVVVKHGTGNIFLNGYDVFLDNPRKAVTLLYDGTQWVLMGEPPKQIARKQAGINFFDGTGAGVGMSSFASTGTASADPQADGMYTLYTSAGTTSSIAGLNSSAVNLQLRHNPLFIAYLRTGSNISALRLWVGLDSTGIFGIGDSPSSLSTVTFRYSTVAGDSGFRPVTSNGTSQTVGTAIGTVATNTAYKLAIAVVNSVAYFSVNDSTPVAIATTMPASTTNLYWDVRLQTQENVAKAIGFKKIVLELD